MALKITLKAHEKMIIDGAVITNGANRCELYVENSVPILRQKDILSEKNADSPARRIYFAIQLMYIDEENLPVHHKNYWELVQEFIQAAPSVLPLIDQISDMILKGQYYQALKMAKNLIELEKEIINGAHEYA
ncbi:flagellar FlbT family protein [Olavius sp. associated proteobacterium Delta 1]|nr:flagellar FlbT family protein [Olavius sp. associated proteobacterium Delta 1]